MDVGTPVFTNNFTKVAESGSGFSQLTSEEFVKIMFTELTNQDPLKPNDSNQLLQQMSSIRSIESDLELTRKLESIVTQSQLSTAGGLIGRTVSGLTYEGARVQGVVKSISMTADGPVMNLPNGVRLPFSRVDQIVETPTPAAGGPQTPGTGGGGPSTPPASGPSPSTPTGDQGAGGNPVANVGGNSPTLPNAPSNSDDVP